MASSPGVLMQVEVMVPSGSGQLDAVRALMRAFVAWHREYNPAEAKLIEAYFDADAYDRELESLPGKYAPPRGLLLYATVDGEPAGCVALRELDAETCEMKRMFVYTRFHGAGVGRALANALLDGARRLGYRRMRLDTSPGQVGARRLYERMGFEPIEAYYELPESLRDWLLFMELEL